MSKHTPGPWHVQPNRIDPMIVAHDGTYVARAHSHEWPRMDGQNATAVANSIEEAKANAALIAAAPELLDALRLCMGWVEAHGQPETRETVRAAIANAEGRTP